MSKSDRSLAAQGFPSWAKKVLVKGLRDFDPPKSKLRLVSLFREIPSSMRLLPTGFEVLSSLIEDDVMYEASAEDLIQTCADISFLRNWEKNPSEIPDFCRGSLIGAWKSVFVGPMDAVYLPCLWCPKGEFGREFSGEVRMDYFILSLYWHKHEQILFVE